MKGVIVVVCAAFGLTVSESTDISDIEAAGQVYNRTIEFVYLGGKFDHNADLSVHRGQPARLQPKVQLPEIYS